MRDPAEIEVVLVKAEDVLFGPDPNPWPGMTYIQGVCDALGWVMESLDDDALQDIMDLPT